jgi:hypothetical protein
MSNFERVLSPYFEMDTSEVVSDTLLTDSISETVVEYRIDTARIVNGALNFTDNTLNRSFRYNLKELDINLAALTESSHSVPLSFSVNLNNQGMMTGNAIINMANPDSLDSKVTIERMNLLSFSPYAEYFIASPVTQGWMNYNMILETSPSRLQIQNNIRIEELEFGGNTGDTTAVKVPVKLALYLLKDPKDVIAFDLTVKGNPSEPDFSLGKIIWKTLANFFLKTAAAPFNALAGIVGANPEELEKIPFEYKQSTLEISQIESLSNIASIMKKKPELIFTFLQFTNPEEEKENLAIQLAKKEFILSRVGTAADSIQITDMVRNTESTDEEFITYIKSLLPGSDTLETGKICYSLCDSIELDQKLSTLISTRNSNVSSFFIDEQSIPAESIKIQTADLRNLPEELKFPHFKVEVSIQ